MAEIVLQPGSPGGSYFNNSSPVYGSPDGIYGEGIAWQVVNSASIAGSSVGVYLAAGGSLTQTDTGYIFGTTAGVEIANGAGTVSNAGTIIGYTGVSLGDGGTVANSGLIAGSAGGAGSYSRYGRGGDGGAGGTGIVLSQGGSIGNTGTIAGGQGGTGGNATYNYGGAGGTGGAGIVLWQSGSIGNTGTIAGGAASYAGAGGTGGSGIVLSQGGSVGNSGMIVGGEGGAGSQYRAFGQYFGFNIFGGNGGAGGVGIILSLGGSIGNSGMIVGGEGGAGGNTDDYRGGDGAAGGIGIVLSQGGSIGNSGMISGEGGAGGNAVHYGYRSGNGGAGGIGIVLSQGGSIGNTGTIAGGAGGAAGTGGYRGAGAGAAGIAISLADGGTVTNGDATHAAALIQGGLGIQAYGAVGATVTNYGTIEGTGGTAVQFAGSNDVLIVEAGSKLIGSAAGGGGTLDLAGDNGPGSLSSFSQYSGFSQIAVLAGADWTLTGTNTVPSLTDSGSLVNSGSLTSNLTLSAGGYLDNAATGTIAAGLGPNLIVDGSFETPNVGTYYGIFGNGSVPGWTSNNNEIEIDYTPILGGNAYAGNQSMELNGNTFDTVSQTVSGLTPGASYTLSWAYSARGGYGAQQIDVSFGGSLVATDTSTASQGFGWALNSITVIATSASETLSFAAINVGGSGGGGNEIDAVSLAAQDQTAVSGSGGPSTVANVGTIVGGSGVALADGGTVTNGDASHPGALIEGGIGIDASGAAGVTVTNYGTIDGTGGTAVQFAGSNDVLVVEAGSTLVGSAAGAGGTLDLAGDNGAGTLAGSQYTGFAQLAVLAGATWTLTGDIAAPSLTVSSGGVAISATVSSGGSLTVLAGGSASATTILTGGTETVSGTDTGGTISSGGTAIIYAGAVASGTVLDGGSLVVSSGGTDSIAAGVGTITDDGGTISAATGNETYHMGPGNSTVHAGGLGNTLDLSGLTGADLYVAYGNGTAVSELGSTVIFSGIQTFVGSLSGYTTFIAGSTGGHTFTGQSGGNTLDFSGAAPGVQIFLNPNAQGEETAFPGSGTDLFSGIQTFVGSTGGDTTFFGGPGNYTLDGAGSGNTLNFSVAPSGVTIDTVTGTASGGFSGTDNFSDIQTFVGSPSGGNTFIAGSTGGYTFTGQGYGNTLDFSAASNAVTITVAGATGRGTALGGFGGTDNFSNIQTFVGSAAGNTTFAAGPGSYTFTGQGAGNTLDLGAAVAGVTLDAATGTAQNGGNSTDDNFSDIQTFIGSTAGNTTFVAGPGSYTLDGRGADNTLDLSGLAGVLTLDTVAGTAQNGLGSTDNFSDIQTFEVGTISGTVVGNGLNLVIQPGGVASAITVLSGGTEVVGVGGTDFGAQISGGEQDDYGSASGVVIFAGSQVVEAGGAATDTTVSSGGTLFVSSGGLADPTTIYAGGSETISAAGSDDGALISGGTQLVYGDAGGATVFAGGTQLVESGGTAISTTVNSGGSETVSSGGATTDTVISGGTLEVVSGGIVSGSVTFEGTGGDLRIDGDLTPGSILPGATIGGFQRADAIDLANTAATSLSYSGTAAAGTLSVLDGAVTVASLAFDGTYADGEFHLSSDSNGGTDITLATPGATVGGPYIGNENSVIALGGLSVSANSNDPLTTVLGVSHGTLTVGAQSGATVTLSGNAASIDAALAGASFTGAANYYGADTLSLTTTDTLDQNQAIATAGITVADTSVPSESVAGPYIGDENTAIALTGLSVSASPNAGDPLSTVLSVSHGTLTVGTQSGATIALSGDAATIDAALAGASYTAALNYSGTDTLSLITTDTVDQNQATANAGININPQNVTVGNGNTTVALGSGNDSVTLGTGSDTVTGGNGNDTISVSGGAGNDSVTLGNGNDSVTLANGSNTVTLGNGNDTVMLGQGINTVKLGTGSDTVIVGNNNNTITAVGSATSTDSISAGNGSNTLNLGAGTYDLVLGNGANTVNMAGGTYDVTVGHGTDLFVFDTPQALLDMKFASNDELVFRNSNSGFDFGSINGTGTATPQQIPGSLFSSHTDGTFATSADRFAYNAGTGQLYYDAQGNAAGSPSSLVATLSNHPHLTASNLFFMT